MRKKILQVICITAITLGLSGCATTGGDAAGTIAEVEYAFQDAAEIAVPIVLADKPESRAQFERALVELDRLAVATNAGPADLTAVIQRLPIGELKSRDAQLVIAGARFVMRRAGRNVAIEQPEVVRAAARGASAGLRAAGIAPAPSARHQGAFWNLAAGGSMNAVGRIPTVHNCRRALTQIHRQSLIRMTGGAAAEPWRRKEFQISDFRLQKASKKRSRGAIERTGHSSQAGRGRLFASRTQRCVQTQRG